PLFHFSRGNFFTVFPDPIKNYTPALSDECFCLDLNYSMYFTAAILRLHTVSLVPLPENWRTEIFGV
ncbi:MAG TPA: hypothetical protein DEQ14_04840, partial [Treponema sp.]|nr:hypothetical protein [Treponema sp.]